MTSSSPRSETKTDRLLAALAVLVLLGFFAVFAVINFAGFARFAVTDMYEDSLIAKLIWDQKSLFPEGYVFGNQFYVFATPVLAALFYGITGSLNTGMALATTVMSALILLSFVWLLRPFVKSRLALLSALLALVSGVFVPRAVFAETGQLFFLMCSFYACYLINVFVVLGDYVRSFSDASPRPLPLALSLVLSFCTGMHSLRQTCVLILPLLAFELLRAIARRVRAGHFFPADCRMPLLRVLCYTAANLLGRLFMILLDVPCQTIYNGQSVLDGASLLGKLRACWAAWRSVSGLDTVTNSPHPVYLLLYCFFLLVLVWAAVLVLRSLKRGPGPLAVCWLLCVVSLAAVAAASVVTSVQLRDIYLFMYFPLLALSFAIVFSAIRPRVRWVLALLLCLLSVANLYLSYGSDAALALSDEPTPAQQVCELALDGGYEYIYGSHDHSAPAVALWSDGKLIAGTWQDEVIFKVTPYLNIQNIYSLDDYSKALFVFLPNELALARVETEGNGAELTVLGVYGQYTVCTSSKQLLYPLTWR